MTGTITLRQRLEQALSDCTGEQDLAEHILASGALADLIRRGTCTSQDAAIMLDIQPDSVRKLVNKSVRFPRPVITERRFSIAEITAYKDSRQRRTTGESSVQ